MGEYISSLRRWRRVGEAPERIGAADLMIRVFQPDFDVGARQTRALSLKVVADLVRLAQIAVFPAAGSLAYYLRHGALDLPPTHLMAMVTAALVAPNVLRHGFRGRWLSNLAAGTFPSWRLLLACSAVFAVLIVIASLTQTAAVFSFDWFLLWYALSIGGLSAVQLVTGWAVGRWLSEGRLGCKAVIIGAGEQGQLLMAHLKAWNNEPGLRVLGMFDDRRTWVAREVDGCPLLGTCTDVEAFVREHHVDQVILALPAQAHARVSAILERLRVLPVDVLLYPDPAGFGRSPCEVHLVSGLPMLCVCRRPLADWAWFLKALEDRLLAAAALVALGPLMLLIAALVKLDSPGPILFRQRRYGFNNQLFDMYKFRTMYHDRADPLAEMLTAPRDPRVTRVGRFLRQMSLDELPQLLNVLSGDMSIVGPRPHPIRAKAGGLLYPDVVAGYTARHRVKPGMTGWAQVHGWRGETDTANKIINRVKYDLEYIERWSLWLDLLIIAKTFWIILRQENAY